MSVLNWLAVSLFTPLRCSLRLRHWLWLRRSRSRSRCSGCVMYTCTDCTQHCTRGSGFNLQSNWQEFYVNSLSVSIFLWTTWYLLDKADKALGQGGKFHNVGNIVSVWVYTHIEFTFKQVVKQTKLFVFISNIIRQLECVSHLRYFSPFEGGWGQWCWLNYTYLIDSLMSWL